ncbi:hypothetical protein V6Z05_03305 [Leptospira venezuelensis]|uniref:hypothetical protein n=1 Tax=Leptospira venezuelensis TaxID=1958811 RepID=UPI000A3B8AD2|nr:hypothetical protein [Leptospira venezuelensis]
MLSSKKVEQYVQKIAANNVYMSSSVGVGGEKPDQYIYYEKMMDKSTRDDLINLLEHENTVVRAYALEGIIDRGIAMDYFSLAKRYLYEYQSVSILFGCIGGNRYIGDLFLEILIPKLNKNELNDLESIVLQNPGKTVFASTIIEKIQPDPKNYDLIRNLAKSKNRNALIKLAEFGKEQDFPLILSLKDPKDDDSLFDYFKAIKFYRSPKLKPELKLYSDNILHSKEHYQNQWKFFYQAVAPYQDSFSKEILNAPLKLKKKQRFT